MSLDLFLNCKPCPTCSHSPERLSFNCTYNLCEMWYTIYPDDKQMLPIDGMTGAQAEPILRRAIDYTVKHKPKLMRLEPPNGWGSYESFRKFLIAVYAACMENPEGVWDSFR